MSDTRPIHNMLEYSDSTFVFAPVACSYMLHFHLVYYPHILFPGELCAYISETCSRKFTYVLVIKPIFANIVKFRLIPSFFLEWLELQMKGLNVEVKHCMQRKCIFKIGNSCRIEIKYFSADFFTKRRKNGFGKLKKINVLTTYFKITKINTAGFQNWKIIY